MAAVWTAVLLAAGACGRAPRKGTAGGGIPGVPVVLRFQPPADGLLTDAQIERFLRVRRAARGPGRPQGARTPPLEATPRPRSDEESARAVGVDPEEFAWVHARIVEALVSLDTSQVRSAAEATYARTIASMREAAGRVKDQETLRRMEEQIGGLERERGSLRAGEKPPAALAANARRVAPRRAEIEATQP